MSAGRAGLQEEKAISVVWTHPFFNFWNEIPANSLSQSKQHQAGALGAADHLGNTDFLFLQQVSGTFPDVRDAEPDAILAEVRNTEEGSETRSLSCNFYPKGQSVTASAGGYHDEKHCRSLSTHSSRIREPPHQCMGLKTSQEEDNR